MANTTQENRLLKIKTALDDDFLLLDKLQATETISELFHYQVELLHEENDEGNKPTDVDIASILGKPVTITITQKDGTSRTLNGIVNTFAKGSRNIRFSYYHATIVPHVWLLTQNFQSRIFQHKNVQQILEEVFDDFNVSFEIQGDFKKRDYCCQYQESDFDFASRIMEEEGLYYYFEHSDETHTMIIANTPQSHQDCHNKSDIEYFLDVNNSQEDFVSTIRDLQIDYNLQPGVLSFRDFNFQLVTNKLESNQPTLFSVGNNKNMEIYTFPGGYGRKYDGIDRMGKANKKTLEGVFPDKQRTAENAMNALDSGYKVLTGGSDCCSLTAGHLFKLSKHPTKEINRQYLITSVEHRVKQSPAYITGEITEAGYESSFACISHGSDSPKFCPPIKTQKPKIYGAQTAFVVGPAGEEIFTDEYGRVKGQFHWDRDGQIDADSSCWIRVAQAWAGNRWGMMFIPRIGMEVVVEFLEGDPDRPIITGCVYNPGAMPPYELPAEKTKSTIKTDSSKGGDGFNEVRFEDKKDSEQVFVHGEKDIDVRNKNDRREWVGNDHHFIVKNDRFEKIVRDEHRLIDRHQYEEITKERHTTIGDDDNVDVGGSYSLKVGNGIEIESASHSHEATGSMTLKGMNVVIEAPSGVTLKCGGSFIKVSSSGVDISGPMVKINSGGAGGSGTAPSIVTPTPPEEADIADDAEPGTIIKLQKQSARRKEKTHKEGNEEKKSWVKIKLVDEEGKPVVGMAYKVTTPEGRVASGSTNKEGKAEVKNIDPGSCKITFPNLDKEAWEEG